MESKIFLLEFLVPEDVPVNRVPLFILGNRVDCEA